MESFRIFIFCCAVGLAANGHAAESSESATKLPDVALVFQGFVTEHDHQYAEILLTNCTVRTVWFTGYGANFPVYRVQHLKEGEWEQQPMGWCGNGLRPCKVGSHKSLKFTVPIEWDDKPVALRVGIICSPKKDYAKAIATEYWSEKIELKK